MTTNPLAVIYPDNVAALGMSRALGSHGIPVAVVTSNPVSPGQYSRYTHVVRCPKDDDERGVVRALVELGKAQREPPLLFFSNDSGLVALHRYRQELERWYRFTVPPWSKLERIIRKDYLSEALKGVVALPRTRGLASEEEAEDAAREVGLPLVLKPLLRCQLGAQTLTAPHFESVLGRKAVEIHTLDQLREACRVARSHGFETVVQEKLPGPLSALRSIGLCTDRAGEIVAHFTSRKLCQIPDDYGEGLIVAAADTPELVTVAERATRALGFHGLADLEFKWDPRTQEYKLLDFNPRAWIWIDLPTACGVNLPYAAYLSLLDRKLDRAAFLQEDFETRWVSLPLLAQYLKRCLTGDQPWSGVPRILRQLGGRRVGPLTSASDPLTRMLFSAPFWGNRLGRSVELAGHMLLSWLSPLRPRKP